jgi:hypothetical protein
MDYAKLKGEIKEIAEVAAQVPETFREKCFEVLLEHLLASEGVSPGAGQRVKPETNKEKAPAGAPAPATVPVNTQIRVFMQRTSVTKEELERVVLVDGTEVHFVREPTHGTVAKGQMEWALLLALKNAFISSEFSTDPEDVRSICQEKGFYDKANFAATFKRDPYAGYFKQPLQPQGARQPLSNDGYTALGELVKSLARPAE